MELKPKSIRISFLIGFVIAVLVFFQNCQKSKLATYSSVHQPSSIATFASTIKKQKINCIASNTHNLHTDMNAESLVSWYGDSKIYSACYLFPNPSANQITTDKEQALIQIGSVESPLPLKAWELSKNQLTYKQRAVNGTSLFQLENGQDGINLSWTRQVEVDKSPIIVLGHATNDVWQDLRNGRSVHDYKARLKRMVKVVKAASKVAVLLEPYKVCSYQGLVDSGAGHTPAQARQLVTPYVQAMNQVATEENVLIIKVFDIDFSCPATAPFVATNPPYQKPANPYTFDLTRDIPDHLHGNQNVVDSVASVAVLVLIEAYKNSFNPPLNNNINPKDSPKCQLSIAGPSQIRFKNSIRYESSYQGPTNGLTAQWRGQNSNVANQFSSELMVAEPTILNLHSLGAELVQNEYRNESSQYVGQYERYLEYLRGGAVVCRTNSVYSEFESEIEENRSQCSLSILNGSKIPFNESITYISNFTGDSTVGLTARWRGTNRNIINNGANEFIAPQPMNLIISERNAQLVPNAYPNSTVDYIGHYVRYLEYIQNGKVVCRTNSVNSEFLRDEKSPSCSLSIAGFTNVPFNWKIFYVAKFYGNSTEGLTAQWQGTNSNVSNNFTKEIIKPQPTPQLQANEFPYTEVFDYKNDSSPYVGKYVRYLEYIRNSQVVCRTNSVQSEFLAPN